MQKNTESYKENTKEEKWHKVPKKQRRQVPAARPDALIIKKNGDLSYAEILSRVKKDDNLKNVGRHVTKVRRTAACDLLLVLDKNRQENAEQLCTTVKQILGKEATVVSKVHQTSLIIKDLDEITTKEEIQNALQEATADSTVDIEAIKSLKKSYGGTQTALVMLPSKTANRLLQLSKIRIGWTICRVREMIKLTQCYKCWQYGHLARTCKEEDRSRCCLKCGAEGHKIGNCIENPQCMLCRDERNHITGSWKCAAYRKAHANALKRQNKYDQGYTNKS